MVKSSTRASACAMAASFLLLPSSRPLFSCDGLALVRPPPATMPSALLRRPPSSARGTGGIRHRHRGPWPILRHGHHTATTSSLLASPTGRVGRGQGGGGAVAGGPPPADGASTLPRLMESVWRLIAFASKNLTKGQSATIRYPQMASKLSDPNFLSKLMAHLDACKDVCDNFGVNTVLIPVFAPGSDNKVVEGFTVKSYRNPHNIFGTFSGDASQMQFAPDPFWDDDEEWDFSGADDEEDGPLPTARDDLPEIEDLVPDDDGVIIDLSKKWVDKMMADLALCPFTQSSTKSGIPLGPVRYHVDRVTAMEDAYMAYWSEVCRIEEVDQAAVSTTLHILPEFCMNSVELFEQWADTLTGTLEALDVEELLQLIFFHPQWTFRDGGDRSGSGLAANYARRSPWPMVNILRTKQVRTAQKGIPTGLVYQQNEKTLGGIGTDTLERMLRLRDWSPVEGMKVDRKDMEALRVANDLQVEGAVKDEDTSFAFDSTPAANKVDRSQIDGGDMVGVIQEALEVRLGKRDGGISPSSESTLNGAQTSAAMMASDFLLEELGRVAAEYPGGRRAPGFDVREDGIPSGVDGGHYRPSSAMASGGYAASYGFDVSDYDEDDKELEDAEMSALFGGGVSVGGSED